MTGLTEGEFFAAVRRVREQPVIRPDYIVTSMGTIEAARWAARMQEVAAECAMDELAETPRWRWLRRRVINRQIDSRLSNAGSLRRTFGWA